MTTSQIFPALYFIKNYKCYNFALLQNEHGMNVSTQTVLSMMNFKLPQMT